MINMLAEIIFGVILWALIGTVFSEILLLLLSELNHRLSPFGLSIVSIAIVLLLLPILILYLIFILVKMLTYVLYVIIVKKEYRKNFKDYMNLSYLFGEESK